MYDRFPNSYVGDLVSDEHGRWVVVAPLYCPNWHPRDETGRWLVSCSPCQCGARQYAVRRSMRPSSGRAAASGPGWNPRAKKNGADVAPKPASSTAFRRSTRTALAESSFTETGGVARPIVNNSQFARTPSAPEIYWRPLSRTDPCGAG